MTFNAGNFAIRNNYFIRIGKRLEYNSFMYSVFYFLHVSGHILHRSSVNDSDFFRAKPYCRAGSINSSVSAADYNNLLPHRNGTLEIVILKETYRVGYAGGITARDIQLHTFRRTYADKDCLEALLTEAGQNKVPAEPFACLDIDAHSLNHSDFSGDYLSGQTIGGDCLDHHTAGSLFGLENFGPIPEADKEISTGQSRRPGSYDCNLPFGVFSIFTHLRQLNHNFLVRHEALYSPDSDGLIQHRPSAFVLTGMEAHPAADRGKRVAISVELQGLGVSSFRNKRHKARNIHTRGAGTLTWSADQARANAGFTVFVIDMLFVFIPEVSNRG